MKKKILIIIIVIVLILISLFISILIPPIKNKKYNENILNKIYDNTEFKNIDYVNKDNNYYIVKIENRVYVLDLNYEIVFQKENIREDTKPLVYKRNNLYYEEKIQKGKKITYNYYSTEEDTLVFSSVIGE